jgi:hypothetical protein
MASTSTTAKVVNYTPEQTVSLVAQYVEGVTVADLAVAFGKTTRSIVAKLSREKVYKAKEYVSKTGEKPIAKNELADQMAVVFELTEAEADSLTKANKTALKKILDKFAAV